MQNSGKARFKRTHIDMQMNGLVFYIFATLISLAILMAILSSVWETKIGNVFLEYLPNDSSASSPSMKGFLNFFSYIILMNTLVPISLYVSVEIIRLGQV